MTSGAERVDAHQHFWRLDRGDYAWLTPDLAAIRRDFGPADLAPHLLASGVSKTVLVQAAPTYAETRFLLELADSASFVAGVVGWAPMDMPEGGALIDRAADHPKFVGVRPMIQDMPDDDWVLSPRLDGAFRAIILRNLTFDALVKPRHLPYLLKLMMQRPELRVVIDHGAKPAIALRGTAWSGASAWRDAMTAIARDSTACCKLSGLVTEAEAGWSVDDLRPYVDHLIERFGPKRLIWGSDWPVVNLAGGYAAWWEAATALLAGLAPAERDAVLGANATRAYRLNAVEARAAAAS